MDIWVKTFLILLIDYLRTIMATESYCSREAIIFKKENTENEYRGTYYKGNI